MMLFFSLITKPSVLGTCGSCGSAWGLPWLGVGWLGGLVVLSGAGPCSGSVLSTQLWSCHSGQSSCQGVRLAT